MIETYNIKTSKREEMIDITHIAEQFIREHNIKEGILKIFVPHTTAAVTINEKADPDVPRDIIYALNKLIPENMGFHHFEGNSDAHTKTTLVGSSEVIFIENNKLVLGTWQALFFCEFDGPRTRKVILKVL